MTGNELRARYDKSRTIQTYINGEEVAELAAALDDRDRLEWLGSQPQFCSGPDINPTTLRSTGNFAVFYRFGANLSVEPTLRAAIDAARGKS